MEFYILKNKIPTKCDDFNLISNFMESPERRVACTEIKSNDFSLKVSTVFLGMNYKFNKEPPVFFETMIFENDSYADLYCKRYETWQEAEQGHQIAINWAIELLKEKGATIDNIEIKNTIK